MLDWNLEVDGPEVMIWEATTDSGARLQVSSAYSGSYAWSVHNSVGWHVTGGYGEFIEDAQRKAERGAARNGL